jgi:hypothetical protein
VKCGVEKRNFNASEFLFVEKAATAEPKKRNVEILGILNLGKDQAHETP